MEDCFRGWKWRTVSDFQGIQGNNAGYNQLKVGPYQFLAFFKISGTLRNKDACPMFDDFGVPTFLIHGNADYEQTGESPAVWWEDIKKHATISFF